MGYIEVERICTSELMVLEVQGKQVWVNTGTRVVKQNISRVLPSIRDDDEREIMSLLKSLAKFSPGGPPGVILTEYINGNDPQQ